HGDVGVTAPLYEFLFRHALEVVYRPTEDASAVSPVTLNAAAAIRPVGFGADEGMLPYPPRAPLGYRLMTEYFTFPAKFFFFELGGWQRVAKNGFQQGCEILIFFNRTLKILEQEVNETSFRLGAAPVVNLFEHDAEPIHLEGASEYRVIPS